MEIDLKDVGLPRQCLELVARVYNHPNSNKHTQDFIRFELQRVLGREYNIKEFLNDRRYKP
ncbi:hypothetical protein [Bacillus solitudinis]|uniref:hypothetical protein n=1 Tax=Bacillus solitudinis TaxID=2014074 RepID=UPI0012FE7D3C|nr:hypothetical protein [Bacillus solitudinis]